MDNKVTGSSGPGKSNSLVSLEDFKLTQVLGSGGFGKIVLGQKLGGMDDNTLYAIKIQNKEQIIKKHCDKYINSELEVLKEIHGCPFLLTMHYAFQTPSSLFIVSDYVKGGDFLDLLFDRPFTVKEARFYTAELVLAIEQLHTRGIMHRDIKLENIMLDERGHVVLIDFGLSRKENQGERNKLRAGTSWYMAPEMAAGSYYDKNVDWWSLGTLIFEMLLGWPLFCKDDANSDDEVYQRILVDEPLNLDIVPEEISGFLSALLTKDASKRLGSSGAEEVKRHPFFNGIDWLKLARKEVLVPNITQKVLEKEEANGVTFLRKSDIKKLIQHNPDLAENSDSIFKDFFYVAPTKLDRNSN